MGIENMDLNAWLAALEAQKAAIEMTITGVRQMLNLGAEQAVGGSAIAGNRPDQPTQVRFDSFFQMSLPASITKYLEMAKCPQSVSEITKALLDGGFKTTSKNLMPIVGSNLSRMKSAGETVNIDGKWGLSAWYPAARSQAQAKPKGKKRGRKPQPKAATVAPAPSEPQSKKPAPKPTTEQIRRMKELKSAGKTNGEIGKEMGFDNLTVWRALKADAA